MTVSKARICVMRVQYNTSYNIINRSTIDNRRVGTYLNANNKIKEMLYCNIVIYMLIIRMGAMIIILIIII